MVFSSSVCGAVAAVAIGELVLEAANPVGAVFAFDLLAFEAYDLRTDPHEQANLLAGLDPDGLMTGDALPPAIAALRDALQSFLADPLHEV